MDALLAADAPDGSLMAAMLVTKVLTILRLASRSALACVQEFRWAALTARPSTGATQNRLSYQFEAISRMSTEEQELVRCLLDAVMKHQVAGAIARAAGPATN